MKKSKVAFLILIFGISFLDINAQIVKYTTPKGNVLYSYDNFKTWIPEYRTNSLYKNIKIIDHNSNTYFSNDYGKSWKKDNMTINFEITKLPEQIEIRIDTAHSDKLNLMLLSKQYQVIRQISITKLDYSGDKYLFSLEGLSSGLYILLLQNPVSNFFQDYKFYKD